MKVTTLILFTLSVFCFFTCTTDTGTVETTVPAPPVESNPAAEGFDMAGSDQRAVAIADSVMKYHGGRQAYDDTRYFKWNFFGARSLTWNKEDQLVRIEVPQNEMIYLLDYSDGKSLTGAVSRNGEEMTNPDSLDVYLTKANSMFINDSYWLVQAFKLKDSGVTLTYVGEQSDPQKDRASEVIQLTFKGVGDTPGNRYRLFVDKATYRINTWQFFRDSGDEDPAMETPYDGYQEYNGLLLSGDRGGRFQLSEITVPDQIEEETFTEF